ncbi:MAG: deoxyguanosinetriphosphate triphosphohydrolase, partial [Pseudomonadota bacterium]
SRQRLAKRDPKTATDVRASDHAMIAFSDAIWAQLQHLRTFLHANMYRHPEVTEMRVYASDCIRDLYDHYVSHRDLLPEGWLDDVDDEEGALRAIGDYIAGMTDRFAIKTYESTHGRVPPEFHR